MKYNAGISIIESGSKKIILLLLNLMPGDRLWIGLSCVWLSICDYAIEASLPLCLGSIKTPSRMLSVCRLRYLTIQSLDMNRHINPEVLFNIIGACFPCYTIVFYLIAIICRYSSQSIQLYSIESLVKAILPLVRFWKDVIQFLIQLLSPFHV